MARSNDQNNIYEDHKEMNDEETIEYELEAEDVDLEDDKVGESLSKMNDQSYRFAGFWMRFWAFLADLLIIFSINGIVLSPLNFFDGVEISISEWTLKGILSSIVFYLYFLIMTKITGQTLGKMIFGLKVISDQAEELKWTDLIFREVIIRFCYKAFWFLNLLYLVVAFQKEKKGLHDMVGQTKVIHIE